MKKIWIYLSLILVLAFPSVSLSARDGRGRGGRGGGGRTPSMSRAARPAASAGRGQRRGGEARQQARQQARPEARQQARPQARQQARPPRVMGRSREGRGQSRQVSPPRSVERRAAPARQDRPRRSNFSRTPSMSSRELREPRRLRTDRAERQSNIRDRARQVRDRRPRRDVSKRADSLRDKVRGQRQRSGRARDRIKRDHPHHRDWFSKSFFDRHDFHPHYHFRGDRWKRRRWADYNTWFGFGWAYPYYYDYGYPIELPADYETYYGQYVEAPSAASVEVAEVEWLPFGVFAAGKNEEEAAYSNMFMELAADKQGNLAGTYYNSSSDRTYALDGYIDQQTQEAFWRFSDQSDSPLISTGLFNLTQDVAPILIDFPGDNDQNWVLVRVEE